MTSKKAPSGTTQKSKAQPTNSIQPQDEIDLLDLTGVDNYNRKYTSLISNNDFSKYDVRDQSQRGRTDSVYWSLQGLSGSELEHKINASQTTAKRA